MKSRLKFTAFILLSTTFNLPVLAAEKMEYHLDYSTASTDSQYTVKQKQLIQTKGTVKLIDLEAKKVTIAHEAIPSINWPAMTMRFTFDDPALLDNIKIGSHVDIDFIQQGSISLLKKLNISQ